MICDQTEVSAVGHAEVRAAVAEHEAQIKSYQIALTQPRAVSDVRWAKTLRKAIKVAHYKIIDLEAA